MVGTGRIESNLVHLAPGAREDAHAAEAVAAWERIHAALHPIIGHGGVDALLKRCIYLVRTEHPWLTAAQDSVGPAGDYTALGAAFARRHSAEAALAQDALLAALCGLLGSLIGSSLTERLIGFATPTPSDSSAPLEDSSPP